MWEIFDKKYHAERFMHHSPVSFEIMTEILTQAFNCFHTGLRYFDTLGNISKDCTWY